MLLESVLVNLFFMTFDALCQMHTVDTSKGTLKILGQQWLQHCQTQQRVLLLQGKHGVHITNLTDTVRAGKIQQESKHESWFSFCLLAGSKLFETLGMPVTYHYFFSVPGSHMQSSFAIHTPCDM